MKHLLQKLDLEEFIQKFESYLARPKSLVLHGDASWHLKYIQALETLQFTPPPKISPLKEGINLLRKFGVLTLADIFEFIKIIRYFNYLKKLPQQGILSQSILLEWWDKIKIPEELSKLDSFFDVKGELKEGIFANLDSLKHSLKCLNEEINTELSRLLHTPSVELYLADRQIHLINGEECLLLKAGFQQVLDGTILSRSGAGFFYVLPSSIQKLENKKAKIQTNIENELYIIAKDFSKILQKHLLFLNFIDKEFDRVDHYCARLFFAKDYNLEFIALNTKSRVIKLCDFKHPSLKEPKPISIDFTREILMITGVNAGGKTVLLKSLLSAVFLGKWLIPMPINANKSTLGSFKRIEAIIQDPQNVSNNISTFAGRMQEFAQILTQNNVLIGIDEIELGTDSDEAASLFKSLLEQLLKKGDKIVLTTHHKRLASLMAGNKNVELLAAMFDEKNQKPTFEFLSGIVGKSYAFETALRYGIPKNIITLAQKTYGEDKEKLNELIENSTRLEMELKEKIANTQKQQELLSKKIKEWDIKLEAQKKDYEAKKHLLEKQYNQAIAVAKLAAKQLQSSEIHKELNHATKIINSIKTEKQTQEQKKTYQFNKGDKVKYGTIRGTIVEFSTDKATIETQSGVKMRIALEDLKPTTEILPTQPKQHITIEKPNRGGVVLDLHGKHLDEALEELDKFLSDSLIAGFESVQVFHGIGTGVLARGVKEFLQSHPKVLYFEDAPIKQGGFGAKIIYF